MRLLIISDVHSNFAALCAVADAAGAVDAVAFAGDAVDYGPRPAECIAWLREHATWAVRGNHDEALAQRVSCRCSPTFRAMSLASRAMNQERVTPDDRAYLAALPLVTRFEFGGVRFGMTHAAPADPMYRYLAPDLADDELRLEMGKLADESDVIILGHTHLPFVRPLNDVKVVNPGSVGQPKHGDARAAYAIWEDDEISLHRVAYPVEATVRDLQEAGLPGEVLTDLIATLRAGSAPDSIRAAQTTTTA